MPPKKPTIPKKTAAAKKTVTSKQVTSPKKGMLARGTRASQQSVIERTDIFISYSQRDKVWMEQLKTHLRPLERGNLNVWVDTKLRAGDKWRAEIEKALAKTRVAILLISPHFLASEFIHNNELPPLLKAAEEEGTIILPLLLSTSLFTMTSLHEFQSINPPSQVLDLLTEGQVNQTLVQVAQRVYEIFADPVSKPRAAVGLVAATKPTEVMAKLNPLSPISKVKPKVARQSPATGKEPPTQSVLTKQALLVRRSGEWEVINVSQANIGNQLALSLRPATPEQIAFLATLRQTRDELASVVFGLHTYRCTLRELNAITENNREIWQLTAELHALNARTEITFGNLTPDMQAQARAELLLLNSHSSDQNSLRWSLTSGWLSELSESPFPTLYKQFGAQPARFRQVAQLVIIWFLHFTGTVQHILRIQLVLKGQDVVVDFEGQREANYQETPVKIQVKGACALTGNSTQPLLLGPVRNY